MSLREEREKVQRAMNSALSGLQEDPWLSQRVLANAKGEKKMKRKISLVLVLSIVMGLAVIGGAYALSSSLVAEFFSRHWGGDLGEWLEGGKIAQIGETVSLAGVDFTLDEVVYRDLGIYGVGTARVKDERDVLLPMDLADGWEIEEVNQSPEGQALIEKARASGGKLLSIDCWPQKIGVDGGSMVVAGDAGAYNLRNEDGSITFSFETGGRALEDGTTYQLELSIDVDEWTAEGMAPQDVTEPKTWTVSFEPVFAQETAEPEMPAPIPAEALQQTDYEIQVPAAYQETGTLPVYRAIENDFRAVLKPEWFNESGIAHKESTKNPLLTFNDHAELSWSAENIYYAEYTDELFDYNWREREDYNPSAEPMMLPKQALSQGITFIASGVYAGHKDFAQGVSLEKEQLTHISLQEAKQTAEALLEKLGVRGFDLCWALDMSLDRIRTLGEAYNHFWFEGGGFSNAPRQDYAAATEEDEGYFLVYTPLGIGNQSDGRQRATLFVNHRGIAYFNLNCYYNQGEIAYTPDKLISAQEAVERLYAEIARSRDKEPVKAIDQATLIYEPIRAENKKDGMVFAPVWQILYTPADEPDGYSDWAEFNAVTGVMVDAIFR